MLVSIYYYYGLISQNSTTHVIFTKKDGFHERIHYVGQNIIIIATDQIFTLPVSIVQCQPGRVQHGTSKCLPIVISIECLNVAWWNVSKYIIFIQGGLLLGWRKGLGIGPCWAWEVIPGCQGIAFGSEHSKPHRMYVWSGVPKICLPWGQGSLFFVIPSQIGL